MGDQCPAIIGGSGPHGIPELAVAARRACATRRKIPSANVGSRRRGAITPGAIEKMLADPIPAVHCVQAATCGSLLAAKNWRRRGGLFVVS